MSATREDAIDEITGAEENLADAVAALNRLMDLLEADRQTQQDRANGYAVKLERCRDLARQGLDLTDEEYPPHPLEELGRLLKEIVKCHE